jgi:hypothetical protein
MDGRFAHRESASQQLMRQPGKQVEPVVNVFKHVVLIDLSNACSAA